MKLEDLLKLSIRELTKLPLDSFEELSSDERIQLIETQEKIIMEYARGDLNEKMEGLGVADKLNKLAKSICPELIKKREEEAFEKAVMADYNRRMKKIETAREKTGYNNKDHLYPWELENLSSKQQEILRELELMNILTEDFRLRDLFEIFECSDRMKFGYYESASAYCAEDALSDVLEEIQKKHPRLASSIHDKIFIISMSREFIGKDYILGEGIAIIKEKYSKNPDCLVNVMVATDGDLRGSCDLAIRLIIW